MKVEGYYYVCDDTRVHHAAGLFGQSLYLTPICPQR